MERVGLIQRYFGMWQLLAAVLCIALEASFVHATDANVHLPFADQHPPNLLFLFSESTRTDDFPMFNGYPGVTPNIQRLFSRPGSILVDQAHTDYPLCNPSRTSMLLGRSPDSTGIKTNYMDWKDRPGSSQWQSLPRFLKEQGYTTMLGGKVFHPGMNDDHAWSVIFDRQQNVNHRQCFQDRKATKIWLGPKKSLPQNIGCRTTTNPVPDLTMAKKTVGQLINYHANKNPKPFALFLGFHVPHFPIRVQQRFFSPRSIPDSSTSIPQVESARNKSEYKVDYSLFAPKHAINGRTPEESGIPAFIKNGNAFQGQGSPKPYRRTLRELHLSGLRQTDAAFGMILNTLDRLQYSNNTLIVYAVDHGFAYGETRLWEKDLPLDIATRVPLMLNIPWLSSNGPVYTGRRFFMNLLDLYRTVAGILDLSANVSSSVEGRDFSEYFHELSSSGMATPPSTMAYAQVVRCSKPSNCRGNLNGIDVIGYTVRDRFFRYIVYLKAVNGMVFDFERTNIIAEELYDHSNDEQTIYRPSGATFENHEFHNVFEHHPQVALDMFDAVRNQFERNSSSE